MQTILNVGSVLGVDQSASRYMGYYFLEYGLDTLYPIKVDGGTIDFSEFSQYESAVYDRITDLLDKYRPQVVAVENVGTFGNKQTAYNLARTSAIIDLACQHQKSEITYLSFPAVRRLIVGNYRANKKQCAEAVQKWCDELHVEYKPQSEHEADALALCLAWIRS